MPYAHAVNAKIHFDVQGQGPQTVLMIVGLGQHASEWGEAFPSLLAQHYRVITMDNRGIGQSESYAAAWTLLDMANDAIAVLDALSLPRAHVLGTSMGGMVAQLCALEHPQRAASLTLMSTSFGGAESILPLPAALALFAPGPALTIEEERRRALAVITGPGFVERHAALVDQLVQQRMRVPTRGRAFRMQLEALLISDRSQRVAQLRLPTLVMHGVEDSLMPVANGQRLAQRIPHARLVLFEGCGHLLYLEQPEKAAASVLDFLASLS